MQNYHTPRLALSDWIMKKNKKVVQNVSGKPFILPSRSGGGGGGEY